MFTFKLKFNDIDESKDFVATKENPNRPENIKEIEINATMMNYFVAVKDLYELNNDQTDMNDAEDIRTMPIGERSMDSLSKIVEFVTHYGDKVPTKQQMDMSIQMDDDYQTKFFETMTMEMTKQLLMTANYLGFAELVYLCCKQIALLIRINNEKDFLKILGREAPFTKKEIEEAQKDPAYVIDPYMQRAEEIAAKDANANDNNNNNNNNK